MTFTDLTLKVLDEPGWFEVVHGFKWWGVFLDDFEVIEVPAGFKTDLASIPWGMRNFYSRTGKSRKPAVTHDYLYSIKWRTRKECDQLFRQLLLERGMPGWKARLAYLGVRAGGWSRGVW